jgi:hypothetical protein
VTDSVNHPPHYNSHESGVEAIDICEHMNFCVGNATKYVWRAGQKGDRLEDLKKARWYLVRERECPSGRHITIIPPSAEAKFLKVVDTMPALLGKFLWAILRGNIALAIQILDDEIGRLE